MKMQKRMLKYFGLLIFWIPYMSGYSQIPENGLIGYYLLEGNGADSSSFEHHGIIVGNVTPAEDRFGSAGKACLFNGGYIDAGSPVSFQLTDEISICAWIKPLQINDWSGIVTKWAGFNDGGFYLGINPDNNSIRWNLNMPNPIEGNELELDEWSQVISTYDGDTIKIYENGLLVSEATYQNGIQDVTSSLLIGSQYDTPFQFLFNGAIDDVLIYNRALEPEEVENIYNEQITSTNEFSILEGIKVFPNPSDGIFIIENANSEEKWYSVFNSKGVQVLAENDNEEFNISHLHSGVYYLRVRIKNEIVTKKIILF